jgi:methylphosphotriester-DNA--protein-cysteine methyltransferase
MRSARRCAICRAPTCSVATRCSARGCCASELATSARRRDARGLVRAAIDTLRQHPRDDKLLRAVERTYVDPAPTQEAAAARLGLPFSTYRRHLTQGIERIVGVAVGPGGLRPGDPGEQGEQDRAVIGLD